MKLYWFSIASCQPEVLSLSKPADTLIYIMKHKKGMHDDSVHMQLFEHESA